MVQVRRETRFFDVPADLASAAEAATGQGNGAPEPAVPRAASTVMVVRDGERGVEVFMLRRVSSMAFAPNRMVFPGGGVDARDADPELPWGGPPPEQWATWLGSSVEEARELVVAAVREVFEECGVLLAGPDASSLVADATDAKWHAERDRLLSREQSFAELLIREGLVLRTDLLRPWAHWLTPEFEPRRYDTRFFVAELPEGQVPDDHTSEADVADWVRPADLLAELEAGRAAMLPPTIVCVEQIGAASSVAALMEGAPPMARVMPTIDRTETGARLRVELPVREVGA